MLTGYDSDAYSFSRKVGLLVAGYRLPLSSRRGELIGIFIEVPYANMRLPSQRQHERRAHAASYGPCEVRSQSEYDTS